MRAVNLIPAEQRRGAGGIAGRTGGIVYVLAAGLLVVVMLGVLYAFAVNDVAKRTAALNQVSAEVGTVTAQANSLQPYVQVHQLAQSKVQAVVGLATGRFNWPAAMSQIALALPSDVTLVSLGAVASNSSGAATSAVPATTTPSAGGPTFNVVGCASSQSEVATVLARLESVPSVTNVSLLDSSKQAAKVPNTRKGTVSRNSAAQSGGKCPLVSFTLAFTYAGTYTVPKQRLAQDKTSHATASKGRTVQSQQVNQ
jgi:Tfp pilus assembly protein PilN